uniref:Uncharacterized protein n=1 Tax=Trichogramma kaykai TaxID=54128 RepID=A0ABD2WAS5_9HYME
MNLRNNRKSRKSKEDDRSSSSHKQVNPTQQTSTPKRVSIKLVDYSFKSNDTNESFNAAIGSIENSTPNDSLNLTRTILDYSSYQAPNISEQVENVLTNGQDVPPVISEVDKISENDIETKKHLKEISNSQKGVEAEKRADVCVDSNQEGDFSKSHQEDTIEEYLPDNSQITLESNPESITLQKALPYPVSKDDKGKGKT